MARTIAVSDEIYKILSQQKLPGESFTDVIRRLAMQRGMLMELANIKTITTEEWATIKSELNNSQIKTLKKLG